MDSATSDSAIARSTDNSRSDTIVRNPGKDLPGNAPTAVKILVAGGFGVGKTTLVGAVSEIRPLRTEETITSGSVGIDDLAGIEAKSTTTVALDFGRITIDDDLILYLFGTPGQDRFHIFWDELAHGAIGAIVLADTRRMNECLPSIEYFQRRGTPFAVAINCFGGTRNHRSAALREIMNLDQTTPMIMCDARDRASVKSVLITLVEHVLDMIKGKKPRHRRLS